MRGCPSPASATPPQTQRHPAAPEHPATPRGPSRLACARRTVLDPTALERGATCVQMRLSSREAVGKRTAACAMPCHRVSAQTGEAERFRLAHHP